MKRLDIEKALHYETATGQQSDESVVYSVRIRIDDLATLSDFLVRANKFPRSGGQAISYGIIAFVEYLKATGKGLEYTDLHQAKTACTRFGVATGSRKNIRKFGARLEEYRPQQLVNPEELEWMKKYYVYYSECAEKNITPIDYKVWLSEQSTDKPKISLPEGLVFESECAVPSDDAELLAALEQGKPKIVEGE